MSTATQRKREIAGALNRALGTDIRFERLSEDDRNAGGAQAPGFSRGVSAPVERKAGAGENNVGKTLSTHPRAKYMDMGGNNLVG